MTTVIVPSSYWQTIWLRANAPPRLAVEKATLGRPLRERIAQRFAEQNRALHAEHFPDVDLDAADAAPQFGHQGQAVGPGTGVGQHLGGEVLQAVAAHLAQARCAACHAARGKLRATGRHD